MRAYDDRDDPFGLSVFVAACLVGTLTGWLLLLGIGSFSGGIPLFSAQALTVILVAGVPTFIVVFLALMMFGLPTLWVFHRHLYKAWFGLIAILLGVVWGTAFVLLVGGAQTTSDQLLPAAIFGGSFGAPTGLSWWYLMRKRILRGTP